MRKIVGFAALLFLLVSGVNNSNLFADGPNDPGQPDTVYYKGAGAHADTDLYIPPGAGPFEVQIDCWIWTDNDVAGVTWPQKDICYDAVSYPTILPPARNTDTLVFYDPTTILASGDVKGLNLGGTPPTPTPPFFSLGSVKIGATMFGAPGGVAGHLRFQVTGPGCICLDTVAIFYPPPTGLSLSLVRTDAIAYVPIVKPQCFHVMANPSGYPETNEGAPLAFALLGNYPNPFNPATTIQFRVGSLEFREPVPTTLTIYNIRGQKVRILVDEKKLPGEYKVVWDGKDENGDDVGSGIYFYKLVAGDFSACKKMILIK